MARSLQKRGSSRAIGFSIDRENRKTYSSAYEKSFGAGHQGCRWPIVTRSVARRKATERLVLAQQVRPRTRGAMLTDRTGHGCDAPRATPRHFPGARTRRRRIAPNREGKRMDKREGTRFRALTMLGTIAPIDSLVNCACEVTQMAPISGAAE